MSGHGKGYNHQLARENVAKAVTGKTVRERIVQFGKATKKEYDSLQTPEAKEEAIQKTFADIEEIADGLSDVTK